MPWDGEEQSRRNFGVFVSRCLKNGICEGKVQHRYVFASPFLGSQMVETPPPKTLSFMTHPWHLT